MTSDGWMMAWAVVLIAGVGAYVAVGLWIIPRGFRELQELLSANERDDHREPEPLDRPSD